MSKLYVLVTLHDSGGDLGGNCERFPGDILQNGQLHPFFPCIARTIITNIKHIRAPFLMFSSNQPYVYGILRSRTSILNSAARSQRTTPP